MRRISKPRPPKNVSPDNQTPCTMQHAERALKASLVGAENPSDRARTHFNKLDKRKLRKVLYEEQRRLCVYCERRFKEESKISSTEVPPIEHWRPLHRYPDQALNWSNLYLSCSFPGSCDDLKAKNRLVWNEEDPNDLPWPTEASYEDWIGFTSGGEAYVRLDAPIDEATRRALELALDDRHDGGRMRKSILHLNHPTLIAARKAAIDNERQRMERDFADRTASPAQRQARAAAMLDEAIYPAFVSTRVAYLRRMLGKHRNPA